MANYVASVLAKAQTMLNQRFQAAELRTKPSPILMTLLKNTQFLIPDARILRDREDRSVKAYLKNRAARALSNARSHNHTGNVADSTEVDITWTAYVDEFSTSLKRADNNVFAAAEIMAHEIENSLANIHEGIETALSTWLDTNKSTYSYADANNTLARASWNAGVYEIAVADESEFFEIVKSVFRQNKYSGNQFDMIADSMKASKGNFLVQQGQGNSTNLGWQFQGLNVAESIEIYDATYAKGLVYAMPIGMTGIIDWIPKQNRQGEGDFMSYLGGYGTIIDPMTGLNLALHGYSDRADTSSSNGNVQDVTTQWELSVDLSPQYAPLTQSNETPIYQFGQLAL